jgi:hypothetical protein
VLSTIQRSSEAFCIVLDTQGFASSSIRETREGRVCDDRTTLTLLFRELRRWPGMGHRTRT